MPADPPPPPDDELDPETREVIERAERAWRRQVEREERALDYPGPMLGFRRVVLALVALSLILLLALRWLGGG